MRMRRVYLLIAVAVLSLGAETALAQSSGDYVHADAILNSDYESNMTIDFGFTPPPPTGSIGDFVWKDENKNGIQDPEEKISGGIEYVKVELYLADKLIDSTETDASGYYSFGGLSSGTYEVRVYLDSLPEDWKTPTTPHAPGSTPENDSNGLNSTEPLPPLTSTP